MNFSSPLMDLAKSLSMIKNLISIKTQAFGKFPGDGFSCYVFALGWFG
jgi:hypothetical protein